MNDSQRNKFRNILLEMRARLTGEVGRIIEAVHETTGAGSNLSDVPTHLADSVSEGVDADLDVLENEQGILEKIEEALLRVEQKTFGACTECGTQIAAARLDAIPYTPHCVACASKTQNAARK